MVEMTYVAYEKMKDEIRDYRLVLQWILNTEKEITSPTQVEGCWQDSIDKCKEVLNKY